MSSNWRRDRTPLKLVVDGGREPTRESSGQRVDVLGRRVDDSVNSAISANPGAPAPRRRWRRLLW